MSEHTPGPWEPYGPLVIADREGPARRVVADCMNGDKFMAATDCANACLIAAAPEMLAALKECAARLRYDGDGHHDRDDETRRDASWEAMRMAEAAIAKAEGVTLNADK